MSPSEDAVTNVHACVEECGGEIEVIVEDRWPLLVTPDLTRGPFQSPVDVPPHPRPSVYTPVLQLGLTHGFPLQRTGIVLALLGFFVFPYEAEYCPFEVREELCCDLMGIAFRL
ncbi:hypothetical protein H671_6g16949 [Cricetulus griseus]|nr:hypothetical protein H671_6g16949 [Cricetulus griseus]